MHSTIRVIDDLNPKNLGASPAEFIDWLGMPTLLRIPGHDRSRCRIFVTLLHGNEPSGLRALHAWLLEESVPAVDLLVFLGAIAAARQPPGFDHRMLPGRRDLNRCFGPPYDDADGEIAEQAIGLLSERPCEALIDLHNTSGYNPAYAISTNLDEQRFALAGLFTERLIHSDIRLNTLIEALDGHVPSVTIECGQTGDSRADAIALKGLRAFAETPQLFEHPAADLKILGRPIRVTLRREATVAFANEPILGADVTFLRELDHHNFEVVEAGAQLGWIAPGHPWPLSAFDKSGEDISATIFITDGNVLRAKRRIVPIMMTTNPIVAVQDCLCYVVSELD